MAKSDNVVTDVTDTDKYAFLCPRCDFVSSGWGTQRGAVQRGDQHLAEHDTGVPMPELSESGIRGAVGGGE